MIRITKLTDYAIVLLSHMAREPEGSVRTARDLVADSKLPLPTVGKILKTLSRAGLLVSHRGARGGYTLAHPPGEISIADVLAAVEGPIALTECSSGAPDLCVLEPFCPVRSNWQKINRVVRQALERLTLAEMTRPLTKDLLAASGRRRRAPPKLVLARRDEA
jgi:FeS assembly SUF system regulator